MYMRVSLLYNRNAGEGVSFNDIRHVIEQHGHDLVSVVEKHADVKQLLDDAPELVVAAGGDGTVGLAARMLMRRGIPLAILPLGTANNIATSLGIDGSIHDVVGGWNTATRVPLDLGVAEGAWGSRQFVEAAGGGLIPAAIADMQTRSDGDELPTPSKVAGAVRTFRRVLSRLQPVAMTIVTDGARTSGEFLVVEILNMRSIGPNLVLSADANPSDGVFHVVALGEEHRDDIDGYLRDTLEGRTSVLRLPSTPARQVSIHGATDIHLDDKVVSTLPSRMVSIHIDAAALQLLT